MAVIPGTASAADLERLVPVLARHPEPLRTLLTDAASLPGGLLTVRDVLALVGVQLDLQMTSPKDAQLLTGNAMDDQSDCVAARDQAMRWLATCRRFIVMGETALTDSIQLAMDYHQQIVAAHGSRQAALRSRAAERRAAALADVDRHQERISALEDQRSRRLASHGSDEKVALDAIDVELSFRHRLLALAQATTDAASVLLTFETPGELTKAWSRLHVRHRQQVSQRSLVARRRRRRRRELRALRLSSYGAAMVILGVMVDFALGKTVLAGVLTSTILGFAFWLLDGRLVAPRLERWEARGQLAEIVQEVPDYTQLLIEGRLLEGRLHAMAALVDIGPSNLLGSAIFDLANEDRHNISRPEEANPQEGPAAPN